MVMVTSGENAKIRNIIFDLEKRIEAMHLEFLKFHQRESQKMPEWERLEKDLLTFSRRKIYDFGLSKQLDRVLYKFQNRKTIWLRWTEELHHISKEESGN